MSFSEEASKAEKWLDENANKIDAIGTNGREIYNIIKDLFNTPEAVAMISTGYSDVDEILKQAGGVEAVLKRSNLDIEKLLEVVVTGVKTCLVAASLF